jgi:deferrochelatase/peroxidase EfeB
MTVALQLADLQGNILQGYGLQYCAYVNVQIDDAREGRALVDDLRAEVTDAQPWTNGKPASTLNLAFSYEGLRRLEVPDGVLGTFPDEFRQGMAARAEQLGDEGLSAPGEWQDGLRCRDIHLLVIIHAKCDFERDKEVARLGARVSASQGLTAGRPERGRVGDSPLHTREHFGFADGFGQPAIDGQTGPDYPGQGVPVGGPRGWRFWIRRRWRPLAPGEFVLGYPDEDGGIADAPALPYGRNSTFMVFRKLAQDVVAFRALLTELAAEHFSGDRELAAAKLGGRWRDGTPLILSPGGPDENLAGAKWRTNDFRYYKDRDGFTCPIGGHIRRANPRDSLPGRGDRVRRHRIIRRGMPYGEPLPEDKVDTAPRGLLFVCFNASIARQFEVVNGWLTKGDAFGLQHGDLLTDRTGEPAMTIDADPPVWFRPRRNHGPLVTTRGGEYLFVPSLEALRLLGAAGAGA